MWRRVFAQPVEVVFPDHACQHPHSLSVADVGEQGVTPRLHVPFQHVVLVLRDPHHRHGQRVTVWLPWRLARIASVSYHRCGSV